MTAGEGDGYWGRPWLAPSIVGAALLALFAGYGQFAVTVVLGDVAKAFGHPTNANGAVAQVGLSTTTLGLGLGVVRLAAIGSLGVASLADRHGRRLVLWLCGLGLLLTFVAAGMPSFWTFVAVVAVARPLLSGTNAVATVVAAEETRTAERAKSVALVAAAYSVGSGLVAIVHGLASAALGFRGVLAVVAGLGLFFPWVSRRLTESPLFERAVGRDQDAGDVAVPVRKRLGSVSRGFRARLVIVAVLTALIALFSGPGFTFLFVYGENVLGVAPGFMAVLVVVAGAIAFPGLLLGRWAADRLGRRVTAATGTALAAVATTVLYSGGVAMMVVGYISALTMGAVLGPAVGSLFAEVFLTRDRATAAGWATAAGVLGAVTGLALFGFLVEQLGSFLRAGAVLWLPLIPLVGLYALLPETRGTELEELDQAPT